MSSDASDSDPRDGAWVMDQAFDIIELLSQTSGGLTLAEIAQDVGLGEDKVMCLLAALEARGAVEWS